MSTACSPRTVAINRQELQQVLVNLMVNAIHAMPNGGTLTLGVHDTGADAVGLMVADTSPGLPPEPQLQRFQPFVTRKKDGTGLGLWIGRSLVEHWGGDITAANRIDGVRGAVFRVRLTVEDLPESPSTRAFQARPDEVFPARPSVGKLNTCTQACAPTC